jgi:hypothetical protein
MKEKLKRTALVLVIGALIAMFVLCGLYDGNLGWILWAVCLVPYALGLGLLVAMTESRRVHIGREVRTVILDRDKRAYGEHYGEGFFYRVFNDGNKIVYERFGMWSGKEPAGPDYAKAWREMFE